LFVFYTSYKYKILTGTWQYSPFSGWQLANNAMYSYRYVDSSERKPVPNKFRVLDNMVREYFDSSRDIKKHPQEALEASTVYMWTPGLPLWKYRDSVVFKNYPNVPEYQKWASMGPFFKKYGIYIIKKYPWHFVTHFIWPNAQKYYAPPVEFLERYNTGRDSVEWSGRIWFNYSSSKIYSRFKNNDVWILSFYPILSGLINVVMLCTLICYVILRGWKTKEIINVGILMGTFVWLFNAGFTIFASSAALRFQSFPLIITTIFAAFLVEWLWNVAFLKEKSENNISNNKSLQAALT
jgi:hypothetical protein